MNFKILSLSRGKTCRCCLVKGGQTASRIFRAHKNSHRLFLQAQFSFLCQQVLTNWVTHKIVLVLFRPFLLYSKRPHRTSMHSGEDAMGRSINLTSLILAAVNFPSGCRKNTLCLDCGTCQQCQHLGDLRGQSTLELHIIDTQEYYSSLQQN